MILYSAIDQASSSATLDDIARSYAAANACAEEALMRIKLDADYSGGSFTVGGVACTASVTRTGIRYTITAEGLIGSARRRVTVNATRGGNRILLNDWSESY